ncbi:MAG: SMP-30/gluconolactonase/LRE family protein [Anaerolineaceae bacterium]|nr:SMP-30/gluconolactonase/LRE family protein [Anaerolineaceae bacterium]
MEIKHAKITDSLLRVKNLLGEGPVWSSKEHCLYWTDIEEKLIFRLDPQTKHFSSFELPCKVGCIAFREAGGMVLAVEDGFAFWDGQSTNVDSIHKIIPAQSPCMMNDGKVDPFGRFWAGSKGPKGKANLWYLDGSKKVHKVLSGLGIANGLDWEIKSFYFTDSADRCIYRFDYDLESGKIANKSIFFESEIGVPDGLCLDSKGNIWTALWDGWQVLQLSPDGQIMQQVSLPVQRPTSLCLGGEGLKTLFITSASTELTQAELAGQPLAGDLFALEVEIPGRPANYFLG